MAEKPKLSNNATQQELDKAEKQFDAFDNQVKSMTMDRMNEAPKEETEGPRLSNKEITNSKDIYLKPERTISCKEKFNEDHRKSYEFDKEYVQFVAENKEITGDLIEAWTRPYPGMPAEFWKIPPNKPVWGPRYLAERLKGCSYHRLVMQQNNITSADGMGSYYGNLVADTTVQRIDAHPVGKRKSLFMGAGNF
jgi:hypothetical protein